MNSPRYFPALLLCVALSAQAQPKPATVTLTGLVELPTGKRALLRIDEPGRGSTKPILMEGDRVGGVEVVKIDLEGGKVTIKNAGEASVLAIGTGGKIPPGKKGFQLQAASLAQVLEIYQELAGRTVLRRPTLPAVALDFDSPASSAPAETLRRLDAALLQQGVTMQPHGDYLIVAVENAFAPKLPEISARLGPMPASPAGTPTTIKTGNEILPVGLLRFTDSDLSAVLEIYQELAGRTVLRANRMPPVKITLRSQAPLTRPQAIYLFDAALGLAEITTASHGDKWTLVAPSSAAATLETIQSQLVPPPVTDDGGESFSPGMIKFNQGDMLQALAVYQELSGRTVLRSGHLPHAKVTVRSQTPLSRREAIHTLDAALALEDIAMVPRGEKFTAAVPASLLPKLGNIPPKRSSLEAGAGKIFPAGSIQFSEARLQTVLEKYAELIGRTALPLGTTPDIRVSLRTQTPLTLDEVIYALDTIAGVNLIHFDWVDEKAVKAIPLALAGRP